MNFESTTPEVLKTSYGKIPKTRPSETTAKNSFLEVTLYNRVHFLNSESKFFVKYQILQRSHLHNKFSISAQSEHFDFSGNDSIISDFSEKSKCSDCAGIENTVLPRLERFRVQNYIFLKKWLSLRSKSQQKYFLRTQKCASFFFLSILPLNEQ